MKQKISLSSSSAPGHGLVWELPRVYKQVIGVPLNRTCCLNQILCQRELGSISVNIYANI